MLYEKKFLLSLLFTLIIEIPVLFVLLKCFFDKKKEIKDKNIIIVGSLASILSLPYLWFVLPPYINSAHYIFIGELIVIIIEAIILNQLLRLSASKSFIASFIMNVASFILGLIVFF